MARDGEFLLADLLGNGQAEGAPLAVATLAVRRYGLVNQRLDAVVGEVLPEFVATGRQDWEDVVDAL